MNILTAVQHCLFSSFPNCVPLSCTAYSDDILAIMYFSYHVLPGFKKSAWKQTVVVYFSFLFLSNSSLFAGSEFSLSLYLFVLSALVIIICLKLTKEKEMYGLRWRQHCLDLNSILRFLWRGLLCLSDELEICITE